MKTLNDKELAKINEDDLRVALAQERLRVSALTIKNLELTQKVISLELTSERNKLESLRNQEAEKKAIRQDNLKTLQKKKGLKEGWGFNPDSGEIVES